MGKKNKPLAQAETNYNASRTAAVQTSPYEAQRASFNNAIIGWNASGDYRQPPKEAKVFFNIFDPAERKRRAELEMGAGAQGTAALGQASPTALALDRQNRLDEDAERSARGYQETAANLVGGAYADAGRLQELDQNKRLGVLGSDASMYGEMYKADAAKPKWWQALVGGAAQVGSAYIGNPSAFKGFKRGGRWDKQIGHPVEVGEEGMELALAPDGRAQVLGVDGPQIVVPQEPATVLPADVTSAVLPEFLRYSRGTSAAAGGGSAVRPRQVTPAPVRRLLDAARAPEEVPEERSPYLAEEVGQRPTVGMPPGLDESGATMTRPRWTDPLNQETEHNLALRDQAAHPQRQSRIKAVAKMAALGFLKGGPGGAIVGAVAGGVDPSLPNAMKYGARVAQSDARLDQLREQRKADLGAQQQQAQTNWINQRPLIEGRKLDAQALTRLQQSIQRELSNRLKEPRPFNPSDGYDTDLEERAQSAGVRFSRGMFGDFKNPATLEVLDPSDPTGTHKTRLVYDRAAGEWTQVEVGGHGVASNYVQPVGPDGLTEAQRRGDADRDSSREETHRHNVVTEGQGRERIGQGWERIRQAGERFDWSKAVHDERLDENERKEMGKAAQLAAEADALQQAADSYQVTYTDPQTHEVKTSTKRANEREKMYADARAKRRQVVDSYGYLFSDTNGRIPKKTFEGLFRDLPASPANEAVNLGVQLSDDPTQTGTLPPSPLRRGAPARATQPGPRAGAPAGAAPQPDASGKYSEAEVRAYARSLHKDENAAVEVLRSRGKLR